jgi:hypothetical protein
MVLDDLLWGACDDDRSNRPVEEKLDKARDEMEERVSIRLDKRGYETEHSL